MRTKLGRYAASITATRPGTGRKATLAVHLSRGNPARDEQAHDYAFTLPKSAVTLDSRFGKARIRAKLGSLGSVDLKLRGRGRKSSQPAPPGCRGGATVSRSAQVRGRIKIGLGSFGTLRRAGKRAIAGDAVIDSGPGVVNVAMIHQIAPSVVTQVPGNVYVDAVELKDGNTDARTWRLLAIAMCANVS